MVIRTGRRSEGCKGGYHDGMTTRAGIDARRQAKREARILKYASAPMACAGLSLGEKMKVDLDRLMAKYLIRKESGHEADLERGQVLGVARALAILQSGTLTSVAVKEIVRESKERVTDA